MNIFDYTIADLKEYMKSSGEKEYRAKQVYKHVYDGIPFEEMTDISKELRKKLSEDLQQTMFSISQKAYEAVSKEGESATTENSSANDNSSSNSDDDVIDAEYVKE